MPQRRGVISPLYTFFAKLRGAPRFVRHSGSRALQHCCEACYKGAGAWRRPFPMNDIQQFVKSGSEKITPADIARFEQELPLVLAKINEANPPAQPHLEQQAQFLVRYVEDCLENQYQPEDLSALAEAIFALMYLHKGVDIIPDEIPEIGYADDSEVIRTVLRGHEGEFTRYASRGGFDFSALSLEA